MHDQIRRHVIATSDQDLHLLHKTQNCNGYFSLQENKNNEIKVNLTPHKGQIDSSSISQNLPRITFMARQYFAHKCIFKSGTSVLKINSEILCKSFIVLLFSIVFKTCTRVVVPLKFAVAETGVGGSSG